MSLLDEDGSVTISKADYDALIRDTRFLKCLEAAGVDNWEGSSYAVEAYIEMWGEDSD